jgi:hypothetical protein
MITVKLMRPDPESNAADYISCYDMFCNNIVAKMISAQDSLSFLVLINDTFNHPEK